MFEKAFLYILCTSCALWQLWSAIFDMSHFYWAALIFHLKSVVLNFEVYQLQKSIRSLYNAALVVKNYLRSIPSHFWVHFKHQLFLYKLGFENNEELVDTGSVAWKENKYGITPATLSSQNFLNPKYISGLIG
jgi:hypothetical protein